MEDRDRAAPVALAREQPVAQPVVDRAVAAALAVEPLDDRGERLAVLHPVEARVGVHDRPVAGVRELLAAADDAADLQPVPRRELEVALVVPGDGHDRAGPVLHQHVVGDVHRDPLAVDRVDDVAAEEHARLLAVGGAAVLAVLGQRAVHVRAHRLLVLRAGGQPQHVGVLGRHDEEGRPEQRVRAGGEDLVVGAQLRAGERDLGALGAADPVALHRDHVLGPLDRREVVEQPVGVVGDAEEPLLELADLDRRAAALAVAVDHLLVREHGRVDRAPVDGRLLAVREPALEQPQEEPLRPAVVARLGRRELARPVDRDAPLAHLLLELARSTSRSSRAGARRSGSRGSRRAARTRRSPSDAARDGRCGGGSGRPRRRPSSSSCAPCGARRTGTAASRARTTWGRRRPRRWTRPGLLALPDLLPLRLDRARVVAVLGHASGEGSWRPLARCGR